MKNQKKMLERSHFEDFINEAFMEEFIRLELANTNASAQNDT